MTLTTFADLTAAAETELTRLSLRAELDHQAMAGAWTVFVRRAVHALTAASGAGHPYAVRALLDGARPGKGRPPTVDARHDPRLERAAQLIGAAGDLLAASRNAFGDPPLDPDTVAAAQARIAGLLGGGAHLVAASIAQAGQAGRDLRPFDVRVSRHALLVEALAVAVLAAHPEQAGRADDIAAVALRGDDPSLAEVVELWARQARDTLRTRHPSARDLQGLAGDLAQVCAHSRALVHAAVATGALGVPDGRQLDVALGKATIQWLDATRAWDTLHTTQPPTPAKIALSHQLAAALKAVTRDGKDWAPPDVVAGRLDVQHGMRIVRRGQDVATLVSATLPVLAVDMVDSGLLFVPARAAIPYVASLDAARRHVLAPADRRHVALFEGRQ